MSCQVIYRRWRPKNFSEVAGQDHVTRTLKNAMSQGKLSHAYIFSGPRGTGKTSTARILAKAVNCLDLKDGEPCNKCATCVALNQGQSLDIIEIDAASNRGIDEIRELRDKINYSPTQGRYKVYIIDEVHMLTEAASNALLKTLEEPPAHAIFVLATTEAHKILATILSRCQRFDFHRLSQVDVVGMLKSIAMVEKIEIQDESLKLIARAATGSLRDAENIFEQMIAYFGNRVELSQAMELLGVTSDERVKELARLLINRDMAQSLNVIIQVNDEGMDLRQFNRGLVNYLRSLLLTKAGSQAAVDATPEDVREMREMVAATSLEYILRLTKILSNVDLKLDNYSTLPLELAVVESLAVNTQTQTHTDTTLKAPSQQHQKQAVDRTRIIPSDPPVGQVSDHNSGPGSVVPPIIPGKDNPGHAAPATTGTQAKVKPGGDGHGKEDDFMKVGLSHFKNHWKEFVNSLHGKGSTGNLDALLRSACEPVELKDDTLVIGFYYPIHLNKIDTKYHHLIEKNFQETFGRNYHIECVLSPRADRKEPDFLEKTRAQVNSASDNLTVRAALEMGARIVEKGKQNG